jgi:hypothetical protein
MADSFVRLFLRRARTFSGRISAVVGLLRTRPPLGQYRCEELAQAMRCGASLAGFSLFLCPVHQGCAHSLVLACQVVNAFGSVSLKLTDQVVPLLMLAPKGCGRRCQAPLRKPIQATRRRCQNHPSCATIRRPIEQKTLRGVERRQNRCRGHQTDFARTCEQLLT